jgi:hypothetical protein
LVAFGWLITATELSAVVCPIEFTLVKQSMVSKLIRKNAPHLKGELAIKEKYCMV